MLLRIKKIVNRLFRHSGPSGILGMNSSRNPGSWIQNDASQKASNLRGDGVFSIRYTLYAIRFLLVLSIVGCPLFVSAATAADGATLYISPASSTHAVGEKFFVALRVNTGGAAINAGEATLSFNPDALEVLSISKTGSVFNLWTTEPAFSNDSGSIKFGGGVPSPGFNGEAGLLVTVTVRTKLSGPVLLRYVSGVILANDGSGTNILTTSKSAVTTSSAPPKPKPVSATSASPLALPSVPGISSPTHPQNALTAQNAVWSSNNDPEFDWKSDADANSFSWEFNREPLSVPDTVSDGSLISITYTDVEDGIWYFHIRAQNAAGWSETGHYEIQVDAAPPESFSIDVVGGRDVTDPSPQIRFGTKDIMSGINHYSLRQDAREPRTVTPAEAAEPIPLGVLDPGTYALAVTAYDRAGNSRDAYAEFTVHTLEPPIITSYAKTISSEEAVFVEGKAPPGTAVKVTIERPDGTHGISREVAVDTKGDWTYLATHHPAPGMWRIEAQTKNAEGALSASKAEVGIEVLSTAIRVGPYHLTYVSAYGAGGGLVGVVFAVIGAVIFSYRKKLRRLHASVLKEVREVEEALYAGFRTLREDVIQELRNLDALQKIRPLVPEELTRRENLLKDLAFIEFRVTKEVQDIERVLAGQEITAQDTIPEPPPPGIR